ncbi:MAG: hypothetical protein VYA17_09930, partial [Pseudomonadota bacterium]|nr:hypothetical protein [Pseudomonadota bacterium]
MRLMPFVFLGLLTFDTMARAEVISFSCDVLSHEEDKYPRVFEIDLETKTFFSWGASDTKSGGLEYQKERLGLAKHLPPAMREIYINKVRSEPLVWTVKIWGSAEIYPDRYSLVVKRDDDSRIDFPPGYYYMIDRYT